MRNINFVALALTVAGSFGHMLAEASPFHLFMSSPALVLMFIFGSMGLFFFWIGVFFFPILFTINLLVRFRPRGNIPAIIGAVALMLFALLNGVSSVGFGLSYYGAVRTIVCCILSLAIVAGAWKLVERAMRDPSAENIAILRGFLYVTVNWGAMPYLGELP